MRSKRRTRAFRTVAGVAALCCAVLMSPTAQADPTHNPSWRSVQEARQRVAQSQQSLSNLEAELKAAQQQVVTAQTSVSGIEAQLADADAELQALGIAADQASEAYDGAVYRWHRAHRAAVAAERRAERAASTAATSRSSLVGYVVSHGISGSSLTALSSAMTADGTSSLINQIASYGTTSAALDSRLQRWRAQSRLARVYQAQADAALHRSVTAKHAAGAAKLAAEAAVAEQQAAVSGIETQRAALIQQLAVVRHTSVHIAAARVAGFEALQQAQLAASRETAALKARRQAERLAAQRREQRREERQREQQSGGSGSGSGSTGSGSGGSGGSGTGGGTGSGGYGGGSGNAATAISFAYAQLGDPYVYGAAGPDAWDCSGLTMGAWKAAGVYLPHYSVAQYLSIQHITFGELRPGDLVFWGSSSSPYSIYHVALYIGDGKIIQAPHPGAYVEVSSLYDWILPNFFGRV